MNRPELVKACIKGDRDSQKQLYEQFAPKMLGVCYRYAQSREEAEDFLQEAFIIIFRKLNQYRGDGELGAWIRKIVVNTSLNFIRSRNRFTNKINAVPIEYIPDIEALLEPVSDRELIELVHQLPVGYKTVFNLYAIEGYTHDEIAGMLGIKPGTSRSQYARARDLLIKKLRDENIKHNDLQYG